MPCYSIKSREKTEEQDNHKDNNSLTSFWEYANKKPHNISIIDCLFLNDEFLLVIDSELIGHVHYFKKRNKDEKDKFRGYTINFNSNDNIEKNNQKPSKNLELCDVQFFGSDKSKYWNLVLLGVKKDYDLKNKTFSNFRNCLKIYSISKEKEILNFIREIDFSDKENEISKLLTGKVMIESIFKKNEEEFIGFENNNQKMISFRILENGDIELVGMKDVKSQEDSLYLIISGCKSAKKHDEYGNETPKKNKRNSLFQGKLDLREKLNLD